MDEHPDHWKDTLLGPGFWEDAGDYEAQLSKGLDIHLDLSLPKRFPFNLGPERRPRSSSDDTPTATPRKRRHLSLPVGLRRRATVTTAPTRLLDFTRRARSPSPIKSKTEPTIEEIEVLASPTDSVQDEPFTMLVVAETATPAKPILSFRGGVAWDDIARDKMTLGLDLFWPNAPDAQVMECLDIMELKPLCQFLGLSSLKLVGMMQSYQSYIWQAAWLNLNLDELELGMALEPEIISSERAADWKLIQDEWKMDKKTSAKPIYNGRRGDGELHPDIGYGEYLDKYSMEMAKIRALAMGNTSRRLSIKKLTLSGFVVDADPFLQWFDPDKLRSIQFKGQCIDAGFWLPSSMKHVLVLFPRRLDLETVPVGIVNINMQKDVKVVELNNGKEMAKAPLGQYVGSPEDQWVL
ncbi:uncharacterized protein N7459_006282 [Penicillium hispanicum]|uniref:uncharacterized protein n=1 Tax=Penicillium hispanicum TaxID=1080232 RepID=UPI0025405BC5|nr:uncharacterized protein N7459_006282 [Penicillium hispanicum]KAJ5580297.1 hypothetical protein N7459_006282 [Penicillium hispanicum]